jgi:hypothetical protein
VDGDPWCYGIEVTNPPTGIKQTVVAGYMFRFASTAGITDVEHAAGGFSRRGAEPDQVYGWAGEVTQDIWKGAEAAFHGLEALLARDVDAEYERVLAQLFRESPVSKALKLQILASLETAEHALTMFDLAHAASVTANLDGAGWRDVRSLHDLAGHIVHQGGGMCDGTLKRGCRRLLPRDWEVPADAS